MSSDDQKLRFRQVSPSTPRPYQEAWLEEHGEDSAFFLMWQQGVGKTAPLIANAAWLWQQGKIDLLLVLAPNGVHYNWVDHELPKHMGVPYRAHAFDNNRDTSGNKAHGKDMEYALEPGPHLNVLTMSYNALLKPSVAEVPDKGKSRETLVGGRLYDLLGSRRTMIVGDELVSIKDPDGRMSKKAVAVARMCRYRRGADGTPVDNGPFDLYALFRFLDIKFWQRFGMGSFTSFKSNFGVFRGMNITLYDTNRATGAQTIRHRFNPDTRKMEKAQPQQLVEYKNLSELGDMISTISSRLTKEDAGLNLPPQTYVYQPFELTPAQRKVYETMRKEFMVEIDGHLIDAPLAMVRLLRLQQITCGYLPTDPDATEFVEIDPGKNPRLDALVGLTDTLSEQGVLWATFRPDRDKILDALGDRVICYRSGDSDDQKREAIEAWRRGDHQFILGHVASGLARGHTLVEGTVGIYYANLYRHAARMQSQDRIHRIGQTRPVTYYDITGRKTVDQKVVESLTGKIEVAAETLGDKLMEWLK